MGEIILINKQHKFLFAAIFCLCTVVYLISGEVRPKRTSLLCFTVIVLSALTALNLVFIVYFLSQLTYLFSAFNNRLPELMTYAEYARRGFFELCTVEY
ncbi:MAG: DUF4153 domain-containing protein [Desulfitobacteriaceae bacterium]